MKRETLSSSALETAETVAEAVLLGKNIGVDREVLNSFANARKGTISRIDAEDNGCVLYSDGGVSFVYHDSEPFSIIEGCSICAMAEEADRKDVIYSLVQSIFRQMSPSREAGVGIA